MEALSQWEGGALLWIQEVLWGPVQDAFFSFYTQLGNGGILWIALCVVLLFFPRTRKAG